MHTNYKELGRRIAGRFAGLLVGPMVHFLVAGLCSIHCHKVMPP